MFETTNRKKRKRSVMLVVLRGHLVDILRAADCEDIGFGSTHRTSQLKSRIDINLEKKVVRTMRLHDVVDLLRDRPAVHDVLPTVRSCNQVIQTSVDGVGVQHQCRNASPLWKIAKEFESSATRPWQWQVGDTVENVFSSKTW